MPKALIRKLALRDRLSEEEKRVLQEASRRTKEVGPDEDLVREGDRPSESTLILEGFTCRYKLLAGGKRQITAFHLAGDFVDLHSFLLKTMDHGVATLTRCKIALVSHETLREITEMHPHLARLLWLNTVIDGAIFGRWMTGMGRQSALGKAAHLLCELCLRLKVVGVSEEDSYQLPMTQAEVGDALGLSTVHTNRVIQELRAEGLITWRGNCLVINDWDQLAKIAEFEPAYLHLNNEPR